MAKTILVTGASGFIGAWILNRLAREDVSVVATARRPNDDRLRLVCEGDAPANIVWERLDVSETDKVLAIAEHHRPDAIIHLAALLTPECRNDPPAAIRVNMLGDANVLEAARRTGSASVVYTSSAAARPRGPDNRVPNLYGACKAASEELARFYHSDHGVASLGLRPAIVYGVGRDNGDTAIVTAAMKAAAAGEPYRLAWRSHTIFEFVSDLADLYVRAALSPLQGAGVADTGPEPRSTDDLISAIRSVIPDADIEYASHAEERAGASGELDSSALRQTVGDLQLTGLEEGVRQTIAHFQRLNAD